MVSEIISKSIITTSILFPLYGAAAQEYTLADIISVESPKTLSTFKECSSQNYTISENSLKICLEKKDAASRRCEFALHNIWPKEQMNEISYDFKVSVNNPNDNQWVSYFQIHSFPDQGEAWRCPISPLEVKNGELRMFNRWDYAQISDTSNGTCSSTSTTIASRTLFNNIGITANEWQSFQLKMNPAITDEGYLEIKLNEEQLYQKSGANIYNDDRGPYLKLGIYKPTSWDTEEEYCVEYRNIQIK